MGCMNELDENGVCHYCSYTDDIPHLQSYLAPRTVLDDRYIVGKMLSYNGEGASYICYDTISKSKAVVREYMPDTLCERVSGTQELTVNPECLAKYKTFMQEFTDMNRALSRMRNLNHISMPLDIFTQNNTTYVILEYVEGVSLKKFLQTNTGYLTWSRVKKLFMPLFTTLSIIHNSGIIHRGISPENIIVTTDGELKLTGFSISSIRTSNTGLSTEFYSGYTAPEQYSSLAYQGTWTDVYAVAAVIYRILTGCMPLDANTRLTNDTLVPSTRVNPGIPVYVSNVLSHAMAVRGEDRIQTINDFVTQLFDKHYQLEHQKGATQTIPVQRPERNAKKGTSRNQSSKNAPAQKSNPVMVGIVTGVIVLFLGLGGFMMYQLLLPPENDNSSSKPVIPDSYLTSDTTTTTTTESIVTVPTSSKEEKPLGEGSIMPNVVGYRYETVLKQLGKDFNIRVEYYYSETEQRGIVTEQSIAPDTEYDPERKNSLLLTVCKGSEKVAVPDYKGLKEEEYVKLLNSLDIKYSITKAWSTTGKDAGYVTWTSIKVGDKINVKEGEKLVVWVSNGELDPKKTTKAGEKPASETQPAQTNAQ